MYSTSFYNRVRFFVVAKIDQLKAKHLLPQQMSVQMVVGLVGLFVAVVGVGAAGVLVSLNQDVRQQASGGPYGDNEACSTNDDCMDKFVCVTSPYGRFCKADELVSEGGCGNNICDGMESYSTCPADCTPDPDLGAPQTACNGTQVGQNLCIEGVRFVCSSSGVWNRSGDCGAQTTPIGEECLFTSDCQEPLVCSNNLCKEVANQIGGHEYTICRETSDYVARKLSCGGLIYNELGVVVGGMVWSDAICNCVSITDPEASNPNIITDDTNVICYVPTSNNSCDRQVMKKSECDYDYVAEWALTAEIEEKHQECNAQAVEDYQNESVMCVTQAANVCSVTATARKDCAPGATFEVSDTSSAVAQLEECENSSIQVLCVIEGNESCTVGVTTRDTCASGQTFTFDQLQDAMGAQLACEEKIKFCSVYDPLTDTCTSGRTTNGDCSSYQTEGRVSIGIGDTLYDSITTCNVLTDPTNLVTCALANNTICEISEITRGECQNLGGQVYIGNDQAVSACESIAVGPVTYCATPNESGSCTLTTGLPQSSCTGVFDQFSGQRALDTCQEQRAPQNTVACAAIDPLSGTCQAGLGVASECGSEAYIAPTIEEACAMARAAFTPPTNSPTVTTQVAVTTTTQQSPTTTTVAQPQTGTSSMPSTTTTTGTGPIATVQIGQAADNTNDNGTSLPGSGSLQPGQSDDAENPTGPSATTTQTGSGAGTTSLAQSGAPGSTTEEEESEGFFGPAANFFNDAATNVTNFFTGKPTTQENDSSTVPAASAPPASITVTELISPITTYVEKTVENFTKFVSNIVNFFSPDKNENSEESAIEEAGLLGK